MSAQRKFDRLSSCIDWARRFHWILLFFPEGSKAIAYAGVSALIGSIIALANHLTAAHWWVIALISIVVYVAGWTVVQNFGLRGMPKQRPVIVATAYGKDHFGFGTTGLYVVNDGEGAYELSVEKTNITERAYVESNQRHARLMKGEEGVFFPIWIEEQGMSGYSGERLTMVLCEKEKDCLTIPITYRDYEERWYQTDVTLERDVEASGGFLLRCSQKRIHKQRSAEASA